MEHKSRVFKWALIISMVVVLNLFFNYSVSLFYEAPEWDAYFGQPQVVEPITNKEACLDVGGQWVEQPVYEDARSSMVKEHEAYCNPDYTKQQEYNDARESYERNIFIILVVLGVLSLVSASFLMNEIISLGLSWGGVLSLFIASTRYWSSADNLIKVLILAIALGALVWVSIKKFGK